MLAPPVGVALNSRWYGWWVPTDIPADSTDAPSPTPAGIVPLPDDEDALAALYAWPDREGRVVRANMIASLDGGSTVDGRSAGLGNPADEALFALLRDLADVILVGAGTVRAEQYGGIFLSAQRRGRRQRWGFPVAAPPIAVVTRGGLDPALPLFTDTDTPPIVVTTESGASSVPAGVRVVVAGTDRIDLGVAVATLADSGLRRIHSEGGPALLASLVEADLLDECCLTLAPMLLGSRAARMLPAVLADPARWRLLAARQDGHHLFTRYRRAAP